MGWLIALGVLTLIAIVPIGVSAVYDEDGLCAYILAGFLHIPVFPAKNTQENKIIHGFLSEIMIKC